MKMDKRKNYYLVLDTETIGVDKKLCYDVGYVVIDKKGNIYKKQNTLVKEIFLNQDLMNSAYYKNKIPMYNQMLKYKEIKIDNFKNILNQLKSDILQFNVKGIFAYNVNFDVEALADTAKTILQDTPKLHFKKTKSNKWKPLFEKLLQDILQVDINFYDIWTMSCLTLCKQKTFLMDCEYTKKGNLKTNAEKVYQYTTQNYNFIEQHTALADAEIEGAILSRILKITNKLQKQIFMPFRLCRT